MAESLETSQPDMFCMMLEEADAALAWQLQEQEVIEYSTRNCEVDAEACLSSIIACSSTDIALGSLMPANDEELARQINDRQIAYRMQLEADADIAQELERDGNSGQHFTDQAVRGKDLVEDNPSDWGEFMPEVYGFIPQDRRPQVPPQHSPRGFPDMTFQSIEDFPNPSQMQGNVQMDYDSLLDLAEQIGDVHDPGLDATLLTILPTQTYHQHQGADASEDNHDIQCKVCLEDFQDGDDLKMLPCCHKYHCICIDNWLQRRATCPVCKLQVKDELKGINPH